MPFYSVSPVADALSLQGAEVKRNRKLVNLIRQSILASDCNAISFSEFMDLALYHPDLGYYTSADEVLGAAGDFTTAPELGSVFGRCLAAKIDKTCRTQKRGTEIYEFGAGSGKLAIQILAELDRLDCQVDRYTIVEISPKLKAKQQQAIMQHDPAIASVVRWCDRLPSEDIQGVIVANELLDAMPVELIRIDNDQVYRGYVIESNDGFELEFRVPQDGRFQKWFESAGLPRLTNNYTTELHWHAESWLRQVTAKLAAGSILIADYGFPQHEYYHPDRSTGTLMCHRRHHSLQNPLDFIGCQDITAHVNFSALASIATLSGYEVNGFTTLAGFIVDCGLRSFNLESMNSVNQLSLSQQLNTLTSPSEMGDMFKVMELTKAIESNNLGFRTLDHLHRL